MEFHRFADLPWLQVSTIVPCDVTAALLPLFFPFQLNATHFSLPLGTDICCKLAVAVRNSRTECPRGTAYILGLYE